MIRRAEGLRTPRKSMAGGGSEARVPLTAEQKKEVDEAFGLFDYAKTGVLGLHEVKVLIRSLGFPVRRAEVPLIVHRANPDSDGEVDLPTFRLIMETRYAKLDPEEEIKKAFRLFDIEGTGKITVQNLRRVSKELGDNLGERELQAMIDEFDKNLDGSVSLDEFVYIMNEQRKIES
ncbi:centrin [Ectocarpus siliculosus]|uniref:Centrin n=1 Tax=Ectocarpus siliculosus TaxID=2880 RepID=D8LL40_ECTSI|nr:centrin [Ectocarpus siliculosus]|eukprot:CBN79657.1 centrin [Ectocarpus siliculosus]